MDEQRLFNKVVRHLFTQGKPSRNKQGICVYRGPRHTMCAVGCVITDREYKRDMDYEGGSVTCLVDQGLLPKRFLPHVPLLEALQNVHDGQQLNEKKRFVKADLAFALRRVAHEFDLSAHVVREFIND